MLWNLEITVRLFFGWHLTLNTLHAGQGLSPGWQWPWRGTARSALPLPYRQESTLEGSPL